MAHRNILSQMFDVRPRTRRGELDLERMAKISQILDLAGKLKKGKSGRVIDLRQKILEYAQDELKKPTFSSGTPFFQEEEQVLKESGQEPLKKFFQAKPVIAEALEISHPSREEILAWLEEIEALNIYLKEYDLEEKEIEKLAEQLSEEAEPVIEPSAPEIVVAESGPPAGRKVWEEEVAAPQTKNNDLSVPPDPLLDYGWSEDLLRPTANDLITMSAETPILTERLFPAEPSALADFPSWQRLEVKLEPEKPEKLTASVRWNQLESPRGISWRIKKAAWGFAGAGFLIFLVIWGLSLAGRGLSAKSSIFSSAMEAYQAMMAAKDSASRLDFGTAQVNFAQAHQNFLRAEEELNSLGRALIYVLEKLPGGSIVALGAALIEAGENIAKTGQSFAQIANLFVWEKISDYFVAGQPTLTQKIAQAQKEIKTAQKALALATENLTKVDMADLPAELAPSVNSLKEKLPAVAEALTQLSNWSQVFLTLLGHEQPKKYLLIFQNTSEARPTGGFIGSYGLLDLDEGRIKNLFVDNIFDLDGQLYEKIIPPKPIQKISTAWSTHDANWFADFPTSAQKIMWFYEKAGGETVDGVISLTPAVIERLLALTGPIEVPEYRVSLNQDNFLDTVQHKVEVDYNKAQNQPKKILADFAPLFLDKLWEIWPQNYQPILEIFNQALAEKHILFYFSDQGLQKVFSEQGWTGEVLPTDKDYLSVVNTNINGFKTDKVVEQKIYHQVEIQPNGSIINTVKIVRRHWGGQSQYDWYNHVNANYLRVYVPLGSRLLAAQGHTLETYRAPVDYQKLGFNPDPEVQWQEQSARIDEASGSRIFMESGKTVFGNWVYVSPGETAEVTYKYLLPFKLDLSTDNFSYSLLAQKQSGSAGSSLESVLRLPQDFQINWQYPENLQISGSQIKFSGDLKTDEFYGMVFER